MKENYKSSERGQVLVLIALGMVALLGFTALAIDGSMMYSDRRYGQNSADASTLAGGGEIGSSMEFNNITTKNFSCTSGSTSVGAVDAAIGYAIARAEDNGFAITLMDLADVTADSVNYVTYECVNSGADKHVDVIIELEVETKTSFVHFVYSGPVVQRVRSVTRVRPRKFLVLGNAVVALNPQPCSGQTDGTGLHGNTEVGIYGGGVWSNGCLRVDGDSGDIHIPDGCVSYFACPNPASCDNILGVDASCIDSDPDKEKLTEDDYSLEDIPDCDSGAADVYNYTIEKKKDAEDMLFEAPLEPGLHCIVGDVSLENSADQLVGDRVTLYFKGGDLKNTGGYVHLTAVPFDEEDYTGSAVQGVVIYNDAPVPDPTTDAPSCDIDITGNPLNYVEGVVLAPGCDVAVLGNASADYHHSQIIGWNVEIGGNSATQVYFDENKAVAKPTYIDLWR